MSTHAHPRHRLKPPVDKPTRTITLHLHAADAALLARLEALTGDTATTVLRQALRQLPQTKACT